MNVIYYFTGTGNSLSLAKKVAERMGDCALKPIPEALSEMRECGRETIETESGIERVGVVFPVYFLGLPAIVHEFLSALRVRGNPYFFVAATKGGETGMGALAQARRYAKSNRMTIDATFCVLMPENYAVLYNPPDGVDAKRMLAAADEEIERIAGLVESKTRAFEGGQNPVVATAISIPVNAWFTRGVRRSDRKFKVSNACVSCGACAKACGMRNINMQEGRPRWEGRCEQCYGCYNVCPVHAIDYGKSTVGKRQYVHPDFGR